MHTPPCILLVDDQPMNVEILTTRLSMHGYTILTATDGDEALAIAATHHPDLVLLDILMPKINGMEVCRRLKTDPSLPFMPIIMVTAKSAVQDIVAGLEAGADEYLTKPVDQAALVARVKSMLRIKALHDTVHEHTAQREVHTTQLQAWNEMLAHRLQEHVVELERLGHLKRFLPPPLAELVVTSGGEQLLRSQRRDVTVVCCRLQGFTTFVERTALDHVMTVLRAYHDAMGPLICPWEGTLERFAGDGLLVIYNAPLPCPAPTARAVHAALAMRQQLEGLRTGWHAKGYALDFGIGLAAGEATVGMIGGADRLDYAVMGSVRHLAGRLCEAAQGGRILANQSVWATVHQDIHAEPAGELLQETDATIPIFEVIGPRTPRA